MNKQKINPKKHLEKNQKMALRNSTSQPNINSRHRLNVASREVSQSHGRKVRIGDRDQLGNAIAPHFDFDG